MRDPFVQPRRLVLALAAFTLWFTTIVASPYDDRRAAAVRECEAIDASRYQSGLYFNPDGYRSFYLRSECFQKAAERFRDAALCAQVRERPALLSSSWGISPYNCRKLVEAGIEKDRRELVEIRRTYLAGHMTLTDFRIELDNNGRDFDIIPVAGGPTPHGYALRFEILPERGDPILLHANGYFMDDAGVRIYIRRADVIRRLPDLSSDRRYSVRATMTYSLPVSNLASEWRDEFIERIFPIRERTQTVTKTVSFPTEVTRR